jgi:hypothetical protein
VRYSVEHKRPFLIDAGFEFAGDGDPDEQNVEHLRVGSVSIRTRKPDARMEDRQSRRT